MPMQFADAFERFAQACPRAPADAQLAQSPLKLDGFFTGGWRSDSLQGVFDEASTVELEFSPMEAASSEVKLQNGTCIRPARHPVAMRDALKLLREGEAARGHHAYLRQTDLNKQASVGRLAPVERALRYSTSRRFFQATFWLGDGSMRTPFHHDDYDNLLLMLAGAKRILMLPPAARPLLLPRDFDEARWVFAPATGRFNGLFLTGNGIDNHYQLDAFDLGGGDEAALEEVGSQATICELRAGEALYMPAGWAHAVLSQPDTASELGLNFAVNVWYETAERARMEDLYRLGCTAIAGAFFLVSMSPSLRRLLGLESRDTESDGTTSGDGQTRGGGTGRRGERRNERKK